MTIVTAKNLHKSFGTRVVLRAADLAVGVGERVGVVGKNGSGKSTLARIIAGLEAADTGHVARRRDASIMVLEQAPHFETDSTAEEIVADGLAAWTEAVRRYEHANQQLTRGEGSSDDLIEEQNRAAEQVEQMGGWDQSHRIASLLHQLGVSRLDARVSSLSGGEQRRVALARVLIARPDLAILDEPTNHLDARTVQWLEDYLLEQHLGAVLLITHDRYLLDRVVTRTVEVADGEVFSYQGGYELYLEQKAERLAHAARTERNRQNLLRRELEWLRRQPKARTTKQKARKDRAEQAASIRAPQADRAPVFDIAVQASGKTILELSRLTVAYSELPLVRELDLIITEQERIGIVGASGTGKTSLLRTILGQQPATSGKVVVGKNTRIAYFDQMRSGLADEQSVFENVIGDSMRIELGGKTIEPRSYLERFGFDGFQQRQLVGSLSGGERARVALAKMLRLGTNLVIMDEPTNDLDVETLGALESMLIDFGVTAIVVTHDRWFLDRVATSILAFEGEGRVVRYVGNYSMYCRLRDQAVPGDAAANEPSTLARSRPTRQSSQKKKPLTWAEERELEGILDVVSRVESEVGELTEKLADPSTYSNGGKDVAALTAALQSAKQEVIRLTQRWEQLETKKQGEG
jgi:ABC transport system ATP-binding/permease protein